MAEDIVKDVKSGLNYFKDILKGKKPQMEKMEEAVEPPAPEPEKVLRDKSTKGSSPFTEAELKQGYRKV